VAALLGAALFAVASVPAEPDDHGAVARTIARQRATSGRLIAIAGVDTHRWDSATLAQMVEAAQGYQRDIETALERGERVRLNVRQTTNDIVRINCVDDKVTQMRVVRNVAAPHFKSLPRQPQDELGTRGRMTLIELSAERMRELASELEACFGDSVELGELDRFTHPSQTVRETDPTRPPEPGSEVDRPPEASTYQ
jgi:hypothetical protein